MTEPPRKMQKTDAAPPAAANVIVQFQSAEGESTGALRSPSRFGEQPARCGPDP
jgi:hypothetical protein